MELVAPGRTQAATGTTWGTVIRPLGQVTTRVSFTPRGRFTSFSQMGIFGIPLARGQLDLLIFPKWEFLTFPLARGRHFIGSLATQ